MNIRILHDCKFAYERCMQSFFPKRFRGNTSLQRFEKLSYIVEVEKLDPVKYLSWWFGIWEHDRPPTPEQLANPVLVVRYRKMSTEE